MGLNLCQRSEGDPTCVGLNLCRRETQLVSEGDPTGVGLSTDNQQCSTQPRT